LGKHDQGLLTGNRVHWRCFVESQGGGGEEEEKDDDDGEQVC